MGSIAQENTRRVSVLPRVVEDLARDHPDDSWVIVPHSPDLARGWRHVTYQELANAVDGFAGWATGQKFGAGDGTEVLAYIGYAYFRHDVWYPVLMTG